MQVIEHITPCSGRSDSFDLMPIGDVHLGPKNCDIDKLQETIEYIRVRPQARWIGMGDYSDFINYTDKRFDPKDIDKSFWGCMDDLHMAQAREIIRLFKPIKSKCLGMLTGNHEEKIRLYYHNDVHNYICCELGVPDLRYNAIIKWVFQRKSGGSRSSRKVVIWAHHGFSCANSDGGAINTLINKSKDFEADIYLMGHCHRKVISNRHKLILSDSNPPRILEKKQVFGVTGTFYNTYAQDCMSYAEKKAYSPTPTGVIKILVQPFRKKKIDNKDVDLPPHIHISQ